ncbi:MAG: hypothetical protein QOH12_3884 [Solirubrobacteraceae bacterium]|jgi:hypothetical protein|nr:hypothetical protein [Solirubrobacteraceae bacterium]
MTGPATPTERELRRALDRLRILSLGQAIRDDELNHALGPFRGRGPIALMCANATCSRPFAWCGLDAATARVHFSLEGPVAGRWDAADEASAAVIVAMPGEPLLRWRFRCSRCQRPSLLSNSRMLALILQAHAAGRSQVTPAVE